MQIGQSRGREIAARQTVVKVSAAFEAAIRAEARAAARDVAWEHVRTEATLAASEAAFEHVRAKVRAAARALIGAEALTVARNATRQPLRRQSPRGGLR